MAQVSHIDRLQHSVDPWCSPRHHLLQLHVPLGAVPQPPRPARPPSACRAGHHYPARPPHPALQGQGAALHLRGPADHGLCDIQLPVLAGGPEAPRAVPGAAGLEAAVVGRGAGYRGNVYRRASSTGNAGGSP